MNFFLVISIAFSCPGGLLKGMWPEAARPFICKAEPQQFITTDIDVAHERVREVGPGARLYSCKDIDCKEQEIKWITAPFFKE